MKNYVVDTHALIWYLADDKRLGAQAEAIFDDPDAHLILPAIVLAEIKYLAHKGRFPMSFDDVMRVVQTDSRCAIYPIDWTVVNQSPVGLDIHDGLIVGTALAQTEKIDGVLTADQAIVAIGTVSTIW